MKVVYMEPKSIWDKFTNQYSLTKTLRFELKPMWLTSENIKKKGLIDKDERIAESYKEMKNTIDYLHKNFINKILSNIELTNLKNFADLYNASSEEKKKEDFKKKFEEAQKNLRKEIANKFKKDETYSMLFGKELFKVLLPSQIPNEKRIDDLNEWNKKTDAEKNGYKYLYFDKNFEKFTTYFVGFNENRKNIYTDKKQSTSISYRLIHENLPKFLDNIKVFEKIKQTAELYEEIKKHLDIETINKAFKLDYYNKVLTQEGIDKYNMIIGGKVAENGKDKIQGLNEFINLYNQKHDKKDRIPKIMQLHKQILSYRESPSFILDKFETNQEVLNAIKNYYNLSLIQFKLNDIASAEENVLEKLKELLVNIKNYDIGKIYINNNAINNISIDLFGDWTIINKALSFSFYKFNIDKKKLSKKQEKEREKYLNMPHSIEEIEKALVDYKNEEKIDLPNISKDIITNYFSNLSTKKDKGNKKSNLIDNIKERYKNFELILNKVSGESKKLNQDEEAVESIRTFLESLMDLVHFVKPLSLPKDSFFEKDEVFYNQFQIFYDQLQLLIPLYNKVRNYITKKPYNLKKIKLNFNNSTLLAGWDANKEENNAAVIFKKEIINSEKKYEEYFLGIINKNYKNLFKDIEPVLKRTDAFQKMEYKFVPGKKELWKIFFSDEWKTSNDIPQEILNIKDKKDSTKSKLNINDSHKIINYFKECIPKYKKWGTFEFKFRNTNEYKSIEEFYKEFDNQSYYIKFDKSFSEKQLRDLVNEGKLYLFKIYNKDLSRYSKGKPNIHTLYWKSLFDLKNIGDVVYKLNGRAEMFFRRKSIYLSEEKKKSGHHAKELKGKFNYPIIEDRRFTEDKFQFHVPITLNFKSVKNENINDDVLNVIRNNSNLKIIGIDRGERNLIYLTLIDEEGKILEQKSLNKIINKEHNIETDYHNLLKNKENERKEARADWKQIKNIRELKEGYLSMVVHEISKMMVEYNAIIVMENLNLGFIRRRSKIEKQVYQKFEKKLIDKLNYLVFKDKKNDELGGLYKALQLTNNGSNKSNQNGFLFYIPAWNTSKIDPTTGFVNFFEMNYENVEKAKEFFNKFKSIYYNKEKDYFEFEVEKYSLFNPKAIGKQNWIICTHGDRIKKFRNNNNTWVVEKIPQLSNEFKNLFKRYIIEYESGSDLKDKIQLQTEKEFFKILLSLFRYTVQMRNSDNEIDYIISPVMNAKGEFYDSRTAEKYLPQDADANGAYNIARKGLWVLKQIRNQGNDKEKKLPVINNEKWLQFVQSGI